MNIATKPYDPDEVIAIRYVTNALTEQARFVDEWNALIRDVSDDQFSEGGQSLAELERLERFEEMLLQSTEKPEIETFHDFADGLYVRTIHAPAGAIIIGHEHRHECINVMLMGVVLTVCNGRVMQFSAPLRIKSGAHTRKASVVVEDMVWETIHPNPDNETDIAKLEERLLIKSPAFLRYNTP